MRLRQRLHEALPGATEEPDPSAKLIAFTYQPGTYKGLVVAIAPHPNHVNLMFARGVELLPADSTGLLEGTGKQARHIKFRDLDDVERPAVWVLVAAAARATPTGSG